MLVQGQSSQARPRAYRNENHSGFQVGLCCIGSSIGLMQMMLALAVMSITWMSVIVIAQALPPRAAGDVCASVAIVGLGILSIIESSLVSGLTPPM